MIVLHKFFRILVDYPKSADRYSGCIIYWRKRHEPDCCFRTDAFAAGW